MEAERDQVWICEASQYEKLYEEAHKRQTLLMAYQLDLSSVLPLEEKHVRLALMHLYRKCLNLRICFGFRDGTTWFRRNINQDIDFQVVAGLEGEEVRDMLQTYRYNSETGPLWCSRLLLVNKDNACKLDKELSHSCQLFFGAHHSIADGITMLKMYGCFISVLNDVIAGKTINDNEQIESFVSDWETDKLVSSKMAEIQKKPELIQILSEDAKDKGMGMPMLLSVFPASEGGEDKTHNLTHILDVTDTKRFINKCKIEGVTVHAAFTALANASTVSLLVKKGYIQDSYRLCNGHAINLRRYWGDDAAQVLGSHAHAPVNLWVQVPKDVIENFWDFVQYLHQDIHHHLKEETVLAREAFMKLNNEGEPSFDDIFHTSSPTQVDFITSNLGDVTPLLTEGGPHVRPDLLIRQLSFHDINQNNFSHFFHTFRGRLTLNLLYNTKFVTKELAYEYCSKIFSLMEEVC